MVTSVYAAAWRAVYRILCGADWPSMDSTTSIDGPVVFAGFVTDEPQENILIVAEALIEQEQTPTYGVPVNGETFDVPVQIMTAVPGRSAWDALDRIETLTAAAEAAIDAAAGRDGQPAELAPFGAMWVRAGTSQRSIRPLADEGFVGYAEIRVSIRLGRARSTLPQ